MSSQISDGRPGRIEFIALVAGLIAINAFAIDIMLPGLQAIGASLHEADENRRQLVIPAYMLGFGILQLVFGPLADRFGRKLTLLLGIGIYCLAALSAYFVTEFNSLVALRFLQGAGAAASSVVGVALVRDRYVGDEMAKTLSLIFMVMMISPILAPALGQFLLTVMDWQGLFAFMAGVGAIMFFWILLRLPETLKPEYVRPFTTGSIIEGFGIVFGNRVSLAYILATAMLFGAFMGFLASSQQIYVTLFGMGKWFPLFFGAGGLVSALGGFSNSQLVTRFGMQSLAHRSLMLFALNSAAMLALSLTGLMNVWLFFISSCILFFSFNFIMSNFGALAMAPLGKVAGTAASAQGFLQMVIGASLGTAIGLLYNGTTIPLSLGFCLLSIVAGLIVWLGLRPVKELK